MSPIKFPAAPGGQGHGAGHRRADLLPAFPGCPAPAGSAPDLPAVSVRPPNASMLFVTLRCVELGPPGAGCWTSGPAQSSLLLDALSDRLPMEIHSLEPEAAWRDAVARRVRHPVHHCPLEMRRHQGHAFGALPLPAVLRGLRFDLVLVDGPAGAPALRPLRRGRPDSRQPRRPSGDPVRRRRAARHGRGPSGRCWGCWGGAASRCGG